MKFRHGAGGAVRNRGLASMGVGKASRLCASQAKNALKGFRGKPGLVSVQKSGRTKAHQRCFPIVRASIKSTLPKKNSKKKSPAMKASPVKLRRSTRTRKAPVRLGSGRRRRH